MSFEPREIHEDPATFHARPFHDAGRALWVPVLTSTPTLVLGNHQPDSDVDTDKLRSEGIELTTRRSGGGAVLVSAGDVIWFDVVIPASDPLWDPDVGRSFDWLGHACQRALSNLGVATDLHSGRLVQNEWSRKICFSSLGPGELTRDGRKLVGMSQRRTRDAARIQVAILRRWDGPRHAAFLRLDADDRARAALDLDDVAVGIPHSPTDVLRAIFAELPS